MEVKVYKGLDFCANDEPKFRNNKSIKNETADFDDALDLTGHGKFSYLVASACAFSLLACGFQNGGMAHLLPAARCDLALSTSQMGFINVAFMLGGVSSACLWGILSDCFGRKRLLLVTLVGDTVATVLGCLSQGYSFLLATRILSGFFIGGPGCLAFTYLGDLVPSGVRTRYICFIGLAFIASWMFLPAIALVIIPLQFEVNIILEGLKFNSWRLYLCMFLIPNVISIILLCLLPESPRLLLANGNQQKALEILKKMYHFNFGHDRGEYPVKYLYSGREGKSGSEPADTPPVGGGRTSRIFKSVALDGIALFRAPHLAKNITAMTVMFANMFGCYGLGLWIPELLLRFRQHMSLHPNSSTTICQLSTSLQQMASNASWESIDVGGVEALKYADQMSPACETNMDPQVFKDTMFIGGICLVYNIVSGLISDRVGVKALSMVSMLIAGVAAGIFVWLTSPLSCLMAASLFQSAMMTGNIVIVGLVMEVFPTKISTMAVCISTFAGRFGAICSNIFFGLFLDYSCEFPIYLVTALSFGGGILTYFMKKDEEKTENGGRQLKTPLEVNSITTYM